ncbi:probable squalene--hopene cyclase [Bemisia tabaci]|uniref:probable squalene--hopene cyclase n=1 Tax=Bemisia tabaci TaxID=7038 RepID=UPI003B27F972
MVQPYIPSGLRQRAIDKAVAWLEERIRPGEGLYGASFNSINALLLFAALGYPATHPTRVILRDFIESLVLVREKEAYLQVVRSPMWDTTIVAHALLETQEPHAKKAAMRGLEWLRPKQILDVRGDWTYTRPHLLPGGWPFQFGNSVYPDIDDTVVTVMAMHRADPEAFAEAIKRGRDWAIGMQSHNGGWGTYDADNDHHWLNQIPFADHGFLIDDQTADVTGRCISLLGQLGELPATSEAARRGMEFVLRKQEPDGKWWCQWGLNYTHGAWSALSGLNAIGMSHDDPRVKLAVEFLVSVQNEDGGWGEDGITYERGCYVTAPSAPTQTAWALLALMAGGAVRHPAVARGVEWLLRTQCDHGLWEEESYQGACAPSLPFLRYHGYCKYFPLWALARYRNLKRDGVTRVSLGL